jgi:catechol 2,3-dioxygenase-like lactoylglutathione lyase family enzyme
MTGEKETEMTIELNHTIVPAHDKIASAKFLTTILGLPDATEWGPFMQVRMSNGVELDYAEWSDIRPGHYAFLVGEAEFDAALARLRATATPIFADFRLARSGEINHLYGGRGVYFRDPNGHVLELITRPYGATPEG